MEDFFTSYNFYSSGQNMELITSIVETLKKILEEDKKEVQPLFLKITDNFILNIARKVVEEKKRKIGLKMLYQLQERLLKKV